MNKLIDFFDENKIQYSIDVSLKEISTFRIGGIADIVCYPSSAEAVSCVVKFCLENKLKYKVFGRCSNVVFSDKGIKNLIIKTDKLDVIEHKDDEFEFGAGVMLAKASKYTVDNGYCGMEFAYGIPGSVGGAVYMNAGAYDGEMSHYVVKTEYVDDKGKICNLSAGDHEFAYRNTFFSNKKYIITKTTIKLEKGDREKSENEILRLQTLRKTKQPLEYPSAGSVFKRPHGYFAGKLIEDSNLRGKTIGGARVSDKHCGFIINVNNATCSDVKQLVTFIQKTVKQNFNVDLECELKFIED